MTTDKLLIFVKNEEAGKTKTRLAASIGDDEALEVYRKLLKHTFDETKTLDAVKEVWYSRYIEENDLWSLGEYKKKVQIGGNLGERMAHAFNESYRDLKDRKVVIIGSDCAELTGKVLSEAFTSLEDHDFVIGPAKDGGYYLLGMRVFVAEVFTDIQWSTGSVFEETVEKIKSLGMNFDTLRPLNDIDTIEDWLPVKDRF